MEKIGGSYVSLASEIVSAVKDNVDVINMSLGGWSISAESDTIKEAIVKAINNNIPIVVAAGNKFVDASLYFPANNPNVITVAAVSKNNNPAIFSNYGDCVDISAPGVNINSTLPSDSKSNNNYGFMSGTSMAAPFVTAAVAMIKSIYPNLSVGEIKEKIIQSTYVPNNWSYRYGKGILNFENIIKNDRLRYPTITLGKEGATISSSVPKATIYYTTDGTTPVIGSSPIYESELIDTNNITVIKAIAYKEGCLPSYIAIENLKFSLDVTVNYKEKIKLPYAPNCEIKDWYSSDTDIATADFAGNMKGINVGNAEIIVYFENNQIGTYHVTVEYAWWQWFIRIFLLGVFWY